MDAALKAEVDSVYGKKGFMKFGRVAGINTEEWGKMSRLPAGKIVEYYMGDSTRSGLDPEVIKELVKSKKHNVFMSQVAGLIEQSNGTVKPFDNESVEQFLKRLGGYVLRAHVGAQPKAA